MLVTSIVAHLEVLYCMYKLNLETYATRNCKNVEFDFSDFYRNLIYCSGEAKGRACRAKHDQNFFKLIFFSVSILHVNISFYVDRIFDLILAKTRTLYLMVCSAFDALC